MLTLEQAFASWQSDIRPAVVAQYGEDDIPALSESWNDYTDSLCKDGELTGLQYHYAPAWDDAMPDNDREFILESMGVTIDQVQISGRTDGTQWDAGASHWRVTVMRDGRESFDVEYSMGSAHKGLPDLCDVLNCLLSDAEGVENAGDFDDWCAEYGYDTDSRRAFAAYEATQEQAGKLSAMFTSSELDDLRELFADY